MSKPVLCAGRLYCDLVFADTPRLPSPGTEVFAPKLSLHAGGGAFITGATLAALGYPVAQLSVLPAAPFDSNVRADMASLGVATDLCTPSAIDTDPQITVAIGNAGDRAFLTRADGDALPDLAAIDFTRFAHLHIGELRSLLEHPDIVAHARAAGLTISLDCGWQDEYSAYSADLIGSIDVFLPNENEAQALGTAAFAAPLTVIKRGANGARAKRKGDAKWTEHKGPEVPVLDATGAGDAFNAGFLSGWLRDAELTECLSLGNTYGAAAVQHEGGAGCLKTG